MNTGEQKLELYTSAYKQFKNLDNLYSEYFLLDKIKLDIVTAKHTKTRKEKEQEYNELIALETLILSTLIGLNREKLELANSKTEGRTLFQYKDYESDMKIFYSPTYYEAGHISSKRLSKELNFNKNEKGPFPYMLEIIQDDNKNRPYDYVSKIRNALLHSEFFLESPEILHIQNHDEDGNVTFEGRLLVFSFAMFVIDFFGTNGVSDSFPLYNQLIMNQFDSEKDLVKYLYNFSCYNFKFKSIPEKYKFKGKDAFFSKINSCFGLNSMEQKNIFEELKNLEKEGFKYEAGEQTLTKQSIVDIYNYIINRYKKVFNNSEIVHNVSALLKLQMNPVNEITNCLGNMITYLSYKKEYLMNGETTNVKLLEELKYDEYCDTAFKYSCMMLKSNIISYVIECDDFEDIDYNQISTDGIIFDNQKELERRKKDLIDNGMTDHEATAKITLETIRNALAHGGERLNVTITPKLKIHLTDIYHNVTPLGITADLKTINNILSSPVFEPENIKIKETSKKLIKK